MLGTITLSPQECAALIGAVFEYNGRAATSVRFCGASGEDLPLTAIVVYCEEKPLTVRTAPEVADSPEQLLRRMAEKELATATTDPKTVPPPLSMDVLEAVTGG